MLSSRVRNTSTRCVSFEYKKKNLIIISAGRNPAGSEANQLSAKWENAENDSRCTFKFQCSLSQDDGAAAGNCSKSFNFF